MPVGSRWHLSSRNHLQTLNFQTAFYLSKRDNHGSHGQHVSRSKQHYRVPWSRSSETSGYAAAGLRSRYGQCPEAVKTRGNRYKENGVSTGVAVAVVCFYGQKIAQGRFLLIIISQAGCQDAVTNNRTLNRSSALLPA